MKAFAAAYTTCTTLGLSSSGFCTFSLAVDPRPGLDGGWSGRSADARLGDHSHTHVGRLYWRPHQTGHEFASGIGREEREPIRRLVELGLKAKGK